VAKPRTRASLPTSPTARMRPPQTRPQEATPRRGSTRQVSYHLYVGPCPHPRHILATDVVPPIPHHCAGQKAYHATTSKGHSGAHAWACSDSTKSTSTMPLQYKPRRHQIRLSRGLGLLLRQGSHAYKHFVTLHLLETIKGAGRDRSKEQGGIHTHSTHILRPMIASLSHPL
jgi:hypothetical protein